MTNWWDMGSASGFLVSLTTPGVEQFDPAIDTVLARKINDDLSEVIRRYPDRPITQQDRDKMYFLNAGQIGITGSLLPNLEN